jgi:hypothetical protein
MQRAIMMIRVTVDSNICIAAGFSTGTPIW